MIEFKNVSKSFGSTMALNDVSLVFPRGKIIGLFGPNGAGKSTSIKLIMGLNRPDRGEISVDGEDPQNKKKNLAYLPEIDHLYSWMNIAQAADFTRTFYDDWDEGKYRDLINFLNLQEDMKIAKISKGQRAKAKLLLTVCRRAPYLLMDEPLSGIDILTREEIINTLIRDYREGEQTIIISTHEIAEVESLVDEVIFLDQGKVKLSGNAEDLRIERNMSLVELMKEAFRNAN
ncbi:ABC transporter-like [Syntrophomonas zehnderi OL-4]|uniref:ABC transporter-like n=1 Tax=Syntrophomonas zehnderi OL-4 TaxID=690567 RepID=A0A0E4C7F1_9FIRM|nr:ABC transporter ATP-binding protein [Syntrophomonas zehnderi]CFW96762.1 ABC transporter-like [Syntrophomonas zehnderi OL-4]